MTRLRFTLAQVMALVLCLGFGFAALRNADAFWASVTYNLAVVMVATALVGALVRNGRARAAWAGFAVFGAIYFVAPGLEWRIGGFGFGPIPRPILLIEWGLTELQPYIRPLPPGISGGGPAGNFLISYENLSIFYVSSYSAWSGHSWVSSSPRRTTGRSLDRRGGPNEMIEGRGSTPIPGPRVMSFGAQPSDIVLASVQVNPPPAAPRPR
jgi:hypothetical protein